MNRVQKMAWFCVICTVLALIASIVTFIIMNAKVGLPKSLFAFSIIGFAGISSFAPLIFRKDKGCITSDERDQMIQKNAAHAGFAGAFIVAGLFCMIPFLALGPDSQMSVRFLPQIWITIFIMQYFFYAVAILVQYARGGKENE